MTCGREQDFLDPAGEVNNPWADPRILVVVACVWVLSKRHFIPTCDRVFFCCDHDISVIFAMALEKSEENQKLT
jgi:predicted ATPase